MVVFPNCKINLGLNITNKRNDGYHDLETIFIPIGINDALEMIVEKYTNDTTPISLNTTGIAIEGDNSNNLCVKAYYLLKNDFPDLPRVTIYLHKAIPIGAGLGGGSANGAFAIQLLNTLFQLGLSQQQMLIYALQLGSDCPFFIYNTPCFAKGRGEDLTPISLDLSMYSMLIVNPGVHVSTKEAFSSITPTIPSTSLLDIIQLPVAEWKWQLKNDFEASIAAQHPTIAQIKDTLYRSGAVYASMTGSGSTVFGLFNKNELPTLHFPSHYFVKQLTDIFQLANHR